MKTAILMIAFFANGSLRIESVYPMQDLVDCKHIAHHQAVIASYPERMLLCRELSPFTSVPEMPTALSPPVLPQD